MSSKITSLLILLFAISACAGKSPEKIAELEKKAHAAHELYVTCALMWTEEFANSKDSPENIAVAVAQKCSYQKSLFKDSFKEMLTEKIGNAPSGKIETIKAADAVVRKNENALKNSVIARIVEIRAKK